MDAQDDIDVVYERMVEHMLAKQARNAFTGCVALLWATHTPQQVKALLIAAIDETNEVL